MATPPKFHRVRLLVKNKVGKYRVKWGWKRNPAIKSWRERALDTMIWALRHEPEIHYKQIRPFNTTDMLVRRLPITTDCSGSTTMIYRAAGRPDPNGDDYNGRGYTGTLRAHTPQRRGGLPKLQTGDFIVYGTGPGTHVVVVLTPGNDPEVFSHGQEAGPWCTRHSTQVRAHGAYFTCHDGDKL